MSEERYKELLEKQKDGVVSGALDRALGNDAEPEPYSTKLDPDEGAFQKGYRDGYDK